MSNGSYSWNQSRWVRSQEHGGGGGGGGRREIDRNLGIVVVGASLRNCRQSMVLGCGHQIDKVELGLEIVQEKPRIAAIRTVQCMRQILVMKTSYIPLSLYSDLSSVSPARVCSVHRQSEVRQNLAVTSRRKRRRAGSSIFTSGSLQFIIT